HTHLLHNPLPKVAEAANSDIDNLLHLKSRILRSKLEVLASEIYARLNLWERNLVRINEEKTKVQEIIVNFTRMANYHLREPKDQNLFYEQIFGLETQRRSEDVECWRDVVNVMQEFLLAW